VHTARQHGSNFGHPCSRAPVQATRQHGTCYLIYRNMHPLPKKNIFFVSFYYPGLRTYWVLSIHYKPRNKGTCNRAKSSEYRETTKLDLDSFKMNQNTKYLGKCNFRHTHTQTRAHTHTHTHTHTHKENRSTRATKVVGKDSHNLALV